MFPIQIVQDALKDAIEIVNKMELSGDYLRYSCATTTTINKITERPDNYAPLFEVRFFNEELKIGGANDDDENDSQLEDNLVKNIEAEVLKINPNIIKAKTIGGEKGWFYIVFQFKSN